MIKQKLFPSISRAFAHKYIIVEKIDGSNLGIFKFDGKIYFAQRNLIYSVDEMTDNKKSLLKGLMQFYQENKNALNDIREGTCIFCEYTGIGHLKYEHKLYMYGKATVHMYGEEYKIDNLKFFDLHYAFNDNMIPVGIELAPTVAELTEISLFILDEKFRQYEGTVNREVEGFIIHHNGGIEKYIRYKNGIQIKYDPNDRKVFYFGKRDFVVYNQGGEIKFFHEGKYIDDDYCCNLGVTYLNAFNILKKLSEELKEGEFFYLKYYGRWYDKSSNFDSREFTAVMHGEFLSIFQHNNFIERNIIDNNNNNLIIIKQGTTLVIS